MLREANDVERDAVLRADVCVAGGGAAGITLALALRDRGLSVVVLESGGLQAEPETQALYLGSSSGVRYDPSGTRLRFLGGTTNHWAGWCRPLDPADLEGDLWGAGAGWPIERSELDRYYDSAAVVCELDVDGTDPVTWNRVPGDPLVPIADDDVVTSGLFRFSPPTRFGTRYRADLERAEDVVVYLGANVVNIVDDGGRISRFDVATLDGNRFRVTSRAYVIAAGGIETARLLLASRDSDNAGVGNANDRVGRYFMDHIELTVATAVLTSRIDPKYLAGHFGLLRFVLSFTGAARKEHGLPALAFVLEDFPYRTPDSADLSTVPHDDAAAVLRLIEGTSTAPFSLQVRAEPQPNPDSRVTLSEEKDALGMPKVDVHWAVAPSDLDGIARGIALLGDHLGSIGAGYVRADIPDLATSSRSLYYGAHHMGTTRMGEKPSEGVVDQNCRVHGVDNLWIAGSSVFPTVGYSNPTLTIVALALRLADHLPAMLA